MKPVDFIVVAKILAAGPDEAHWRSAVSRAYYGAFHAALQLLASYGITFPKASSAHEKVAQCLQNSGDEELAEAGRRVASLREKRNIADYHLDDKRLTVAEAVSFELGRADVVISVIAKAYRDPSAVRESIRNYARHVLKLNVVGED